MPNIDELLKQYGGQLSSVLPLLLLFVFWWIFSMLGSRLRKTGEKSEETDSPGLQDRVLQIMTGGQGEEVDPRHQKPAGQSDNVPWAREPGVYDQGPVAPTGEFKPKPINPRWWGV